jgi:solute carrier family 25 citrate transporter 1
MTIQCTCLAFDVLKTKMQGLDGNKYRNTFDCARQIMKREGVFGFYAGIVPRLGRVIPGQGVIFMSYDSITRVVATYVIDS